MSRYSQWSVTGARTLTFDEQPIEALHVRIGNGTVNVVGTDRPTTRIEVAEVSGPPLAVRLEGGQLTVAYEDLPWKGFLGWFDHKPWRRRAVVSISVPAASRLTVGVVGASAVVSGVAGHTGIRQVSGDTTLVGLSGRVSADTISGDLQAQALGGALRFNSVSGSLTVIDGTGPELSGESVSGDMVVDVAACEAPADIRLNSVSGELALRLPDPVSAEVCATTASGAISSAFTELDAHRTWGARRLTGRLGSGSGSVHCSTVSGSIALLRRPDGQDDTGGVPAAASPSVKDV